MGLLGCGLAGEGWFGNEMAAPQADVGTDNRLHQVKNFVGQQKFQ
jgi:hypothetical protein